MASIFDERYLQEPSREWADELEAWLQERGYAIRNGAYSHPCEYQRGHVRVRINYGGIVILRDPGCTIQITRMVRGSGGMEEFVTPNAHRIDQRPGNLEVMQSRIVGFEDHLAFTREEARQHFFGEEAVHA